MSKGEQKKDRTALIESIRKIHEEMVPFTKMLGMKFEIRDEDNVFVRFEKRDELVGNPITGILHGGVISAVLDATGGLIGILEIIKKMRNPSLEKVGEELKKRGTIDLRIDYLRPGQGKRFTATGSVLRTGKKVTVTRMELINEENTLIAVGTGTYLIG